MKGVEWPVGECGAEAGTEMEEVKKGSGKQGRKRTKGINAKSKIRAWMKW